MPFSCLFRVFCYIGKVLQVEINRYWNAFIWFGNTITSVLKYYYFTQSFWIHRTSGIIHNHTARGLFPYFSLISSLPSSTPCMPCIFPCNCNIGSPSRNRRIRTRLVLAVARVSPSCYFTPLLLSGSGLSQKQRRPLILFLSHTIRVQSGFDFTPLSVMSIVVSGCCHSPSNPRITLCPQFLHFSQLSHVTCFTASPLSFVVFSPSILLSYSNAILFRVQGIASILFLGCPVMGQELALFRVVRL